MLMTKKLLDYTLEEVLNKFGKGEHVPGSGSAAALFSLISSQLSQTVLILSTDKKRKNRLASFQIRAEELKLKLANTHYPKLAELFQRDSDLFDKAIKKRQQRDRADEDEEINILDREALIALIPATSILVEIAELSRELAYFAVEIFDNGFHAARGDSHAAIMSANATLGSCLSILNLNLTSFRTDKWFKQMKDEARRLAKIHDELTQVARQKLQILEKEVDEREKFHEDIEKFLEQPEKWYSEPEIEEEARRFQNLLWNNRKILKRKASDSDFLAILKPKIVIKALGYEFEERASLGYDDYEMDKYEIAGIINRPEKRILLSARFNTQVKNFTAAHELGHALLHRDAVMHRDKPRDGVRSIPKDRKEWEADKFAAYFLMPTKQVIKEFMKRFGTEQLFLDENTIFALNQSNPTLFRNQYRTEIDQYRLIAGTSDYNGNSFESMAEQFNVSIEAMAIRLIELKMLV